ncbi:archease [Bacteroidota bacterium]
MGKFEVIEHTADIAIDVTGESLEDLFITSAQAFKHLSTDLEFSEKPEYRIISVEASTLEDLLVDFLSELNYLLLIKKWMFTHLTKLELKSEENKFLLNTTLTGTRINLDKIELKSEIKAVTYHQLNIREELSGYNTKIIFDT